MVGKEPAAKGKRKFPGDVVKVSNTVIREEEPEISAEASAQDYISEADLVDLPVVDDLEVAACAAAAALGSPVDAHAQSSSEESSEEETSESETGQSSEEESDEDEASSEDESGSRKPGPDFKRIRLSIITEGDLARLKLEFPSLEKVDGLMNGDKKVPVADDSSAESVGGSDIADAEDYKKLLENMLAEGEERDDSREQAAREAAKVPAEPLDIEILPEEEMASVGHILSIVDEDQIVVQAPAYARVVHEGSVFCLDDRHPLGRVQELLGPVTEPLYFLAYAGPQPLPEKVCAGAKVSCFTRYSEYVLEDDLKAPVQDAGSEADADDEQFSEDDAEVLLQQLDIRQEGRRVSTGSKAVGEDLAEQQYRKKLNVRTYGNTPRTSQPQQSVERPEPSAGRHSQRSRGGGRGGRGASQSSFRSNQAPGAINSQSPSAPGSSQREFRSPMQAEIPMAAGSAGGNNRNSAKRNLSADCVAQDFQPRPAADGGMWMYVPPPEKQNSYQSPHYPADQGFRPQQYRQPQAWLPPQSPRQPQHAARPPLLSPRPPPQQQYSPYSPPPFQQPFQQQFPTQMGYAQPYASPPVQAHPQMHPAMMNPAVNTGRQMPGYGYSPPPDQQQYGAPYRPAPASPQYPAGGYYPNGLP